MSKDVSAAAGALVHNMNPPNSTMVTTVPWLQQWHMHGVVLCSRPEQVVIIYTSRTHVHPFTQTRCSCSTIHVVQLHQNFITYQPSLSRNAGCPWGMWTDYTTHSVAMIFNLSALRALLLRRSLSSGPAEESMQIYSKKRNSHS